MKKLSRRTFGTPCKSRDFFRKKHFRQKYTNDVFLGLVFDGDHESAIIFMKMHKIYGKNIDNI
jgi:hypothetical protein